MAKLLLVTNHGLSRRQLRDARASLSINRAVPMPEHVAALWLAVPPMLPTLGDYLKPVERWLRRESEPGDRILIQGDFGASHILVRIAQDLGLVAVYATSVRDVTERSGPDGAVQSIRSFRHVRFRRYGD